MGTGFFAKPQALDDWFRVPALLGTLVIGLLGAVALVVGLPLMVLFASTGGGFDMVLTGVPLVLFPFPAWRAIKAISAGRMRKACLWSFIPLIILPALYLAITA